MSGRRRIGGGAVIIAVALAGGVGARAQVGPATDPSITDGRAQAALDAARARWKASRTVSYRMRVALGCFCPEDIRRPRTITVRRGLPLRPPSHLKDVATVPRLFRTIQRAIDADVADLTVRYGRRGVPSSIAIDNDRRIADEERYYTIDRFARLRS
jgi:hypothetical protein